MGTSPEAGREPPSLSHTPSALRQLSHRSASSHRGGPAHGGRHLNRPPPLELFPRSSLRLVPSSRLAAPRAEAPADTYGTAPTF